MQISLVKMLLQNKFIRFITYNYEHAIEQIVRDCNQSFELCVVADKNRLFQKLETTVTETPMLYITTGMYDLLSDNEIINLYFSKTRKNNIYWIDCCITPQKPAYFIVDVSHLSTSALQHLNTAQKLKYLSIEKYLQLIDLPQEFKVAGNETYKHFLASKPSRSTILFTGVSGIGKSYLSKYTAHAWQIPILRLNFNALLSRYFGEAEHHFAKLLNSLHLLTPCVIWIEEIDKLFISYQTESTGSIARLLADLLFFLQEKEIDNLHIVATANDISKIPKELTRRFQYEFYIPLPSKETIKELCALYNYPVNNTKLKSLLNKTYDEIVKIITK